MRRRRGVSVGELVVVMAVGTILAGLLGGSFGEIKIRMSVRSAEAKLVTLHRRAGTLAIESGLPIHFLADPQTQTVTLREGCHGEGRTIAYHDFNLSHRVDMLTSGGVIAICMTPNGYAHPGMGSLAQQGRVTFLRGEHSRSVVLPPPARLAGT